MGSLNNTNNSSIIKLSTDLSGKCDGNVVENALNCDGESVFNLLDQMTKRPCWSLGNSICGYRTNE